MTISLAIDTSTSRTIVGIIDGDEILYVILLGLLHAKIFTGGIVGTVMSNLGLELAINDLGFNFIRTKVGDQHIVEQLKKQKWIKIPNNR